MTTQPISITPARAWTLIFLGCTIGMLTFGPRAISGLFQAPMTDAHGWSREAFAFAIAIQNLAWGVAQPLAGMVADKFGTVRTITFGAIVYVLGLYWMSSATDPVTLTLSAGVLVGIGIATSAFFLIISAFARMLPERYHGIAFGFGTASGSLGQFVFSPLGQGFIDAYGYQSTLLILAGCVAVVPFLAIPFRGRSDMGGSVAAPAQSVGNALAEAFGHRSYMLLLFGFFVCGYHVAFITVHMPAYVTDLGLDPSIGAWSIATIGLFNIFGAISSGLMMNRIPKRYILAFIYAGRALVISIFVLTPISTTSVLVFSAAMGVLWLSTIPPTQGLVKVMFGTRYMSTLFGFVFLSHQVGSFLGVWLGGRIFDATGSYDAMWWSSVVAGLAAVLLHWPIDESPAREAIA